MPLNPYASFLDGRDPIPVLSSTAERIRELTSGRSSEEVDTPPAPGKWSMREIVAHLADCETVFSFRLRQAMAEESPIMQPFDQQAWATRYNAYRLGPALALFQAAREWNLLWLATLSEDDRNRATAHPERGAMTLWTIVETMAGHDLNHLQQLERLQPGL